MPLKHYITAVSLDPLPPGDQIRDKVEDFMMRQKRPGDILRALADLLDAAHDRMDVPVGPATDPVREAPEWIPDYRQRANRRTYRCSAEHAAQLAALSRATGLDQASLIRLALAEAKTREPRLL